MLNTYIGIEERLLSLSPRYYFVRDLHTYSRYSYEPLEVEVKQRPTSLYTTTR